MGDRDFEIGDLVRIRDWDDMVDEFGYNGNENSIPCKYSFITDMRYLCGTEFEITDITGYQVYGCESDGFTISTDMIEHCDSMKRAEPVELDLGNLYDAFKIS